MENALLLSLSTTSVDALQLLYFARGVPPERPLIPAIRFKLDIHSDVNCKSDFRFDRATICALTLHFALPEYVLPTPKPGPIQQVWACRGPNHQDILSYEYINSLIYFHKSLYRRSIATYASAVEARSAPMLNFFGFIDGTKIAISRPSSRRGHRESLQKQVYSGHKRVHCLTYQSVVVPDGLAIHFWRPIEGKRHDVTLLYESKLMKFFETQDDIFRGYALYGDPAYPI
ncbi:DDE superfamily endonuclease [Phytophthora infestans]|uniref:DDE superfamily endonuclease n=1 Tax=Phytophthora infestans TaxID=4787 RepID=A0A8S9V8L3_PHYIN|nr:DDE superfamily endonuclease [Phytophthora infestans]